MPAIDISGCCIPAECDNIKLPYNGEIASRWDAYLLCDICRHFASVMLHFASLISHNLRCIPAYTHLIPTGFFQSSLNNHRDNFYIFFHASLRVLLKSFPPESHQICTEKMQFPPKTAFSWCNFRHFLHFFSAILVYLHKYKMVWTDYSVFSNVNSKKPQPIFFATNTTKFVGIATHSDW